MPLPVTVVLFVSTHPDRFLVAVRSLLDSTELPIQVGVLYPSFGAEFDDLGARVGWRPMGSVSELVNRVHAETRGHVVVVDDAVMLPPDPFSTALRWIDEDLRVATVSFLCNAADFLSFPTRNLPVDRPPDGHDEMTVTRRLRELEPAAEPAPIAHAAGAVVVLSAAALGAVGELQAPVSARFDIAVADFSARSRAKGFVDVLDASTFYARPSDVAIYPIGHQITPDDRGWLLSQAGWKALRVGGTCEIQMKRLRRIEQVVREIGAQLSQFLLNRIEPFTIFARETNTRQLGTLHHPCNDSLLGTAEARPLR